jgi:hypothetical protein
MYDNDAWAALDAQVAAQHRQDRDLREQVAAAVFASLVGSRIYNDHEAVRAAYRAADTFVAEKPLT